MEEEGYSPLEHSLFDRIKKLENLLLQHQDFTQWLEEQIDNDLLHNPSIIATMVYKLNKLNHD